MDQERNKTGGSAYGGTSGWSPTSQPGPASGRNSITPSHSGGTSVGNTSRDEETGTGIGTSAGREPGARLTDVADEIRQNARQLRSQATERGTAMLHDVQDRVSGAIDQGKGRLANEICAIGDVLQDAAGRLEGEHGAAGRYARMAAEQVNGLGDFLRDADPERMLSEFQSFARRRPEVFLGGAVLAGLLLGRFLRSHEPRRDYGSGQYGRSNDFGYEEDFSDEGTSTGYGTAKRISTGSTGAGSGIGSAVTGSGSSSWSAGSTGGASGGAGYSSSGRGGSTSNLNTGNRGGDSSPAI
jgi:hypothetical protein